MNVHGKFFSEIPAVKADHHFCTVTFDYLIHVDILISDLGGLFTFQHELVAGGSNSVLCGCSWLGMLHSRSVGGQAVTSLCIRWAFSPWNCQGNDFQLFMMFPLLPLEIRFAVTAIVVFHVLQCELFLFHLSMDPGSTH